MRILYLAVDNRTKVQKILDATVRQECSTKSLLLPPIVPLIPLLFLPTMDYKMHLSALSSFWGGIIFRQQSLDAGISDFVSPLA